MKHTKNDEINKNFSFFVCFVYFRMFRSSSSDLAKSPPRSLFRFWKKAGWMSLLLPRIP
jgi:hypothetical protein